MGRLSLAASTRALSRFSGRAVRVIVNRVPLPGLLSTSIAPPTLSRILCTVESPRPVPLPFGLVVKNGSKIRSRTSVGIPLPLSSTIIRTQSSPQLEVKRAIRGSDCSSSASTALMSRFSITCSILPLSTRKSTGRSSISTSISIAFLVICRTNWILVRIASPRGPALESRLELRANPSRVRASREALTEAASIVLAYCSTLSGVAPCDFNNELYPIMALRMLLKSCTMPLVSVPRPSIFWE